MSQKVIDPVEDQVERDLSFFQNEGYSIASEQEHLKKLFMSHAPTRRSFDHLVQTLKEYTCGTTNIHEESNKHGQRTLTRSVENCFRLNRSVVRKILFQLIEEMKNAASNAQVDNDREKKYSIMAKVALAEAIEKQKITGSLPDTISRFGKISVTLSNLDQQIASANDNLDNIAKQKTGKESSSRHMVAPNLEELIKALRDIPEDLQDEDLEQNRHLRRLLAMKLYHDLHEDYQKNKKIANDQETYTMWKRGLEELIRELK